jgi:hypothetical protein
MQPARLCAKDVYVQLEQLRTNVRGKDQRPEPGPEAEAVAIETMGQAG